MKTRIHNSKDFYAGLLFVAIGLVAVLTAAVSYPLGTAVHVGPAGFPILVGGILTVLGLVVMLNAIRVGGEKIAVASPRALILVLAAVLSFALVDAIGVVLATLVLVVLGAAAGWQFRIREVAVLYVVLTAVVVGVFVYGLEVPLKLWPN